MKRKGNKMNHSIKLTALAFSMAFVLTGCASKNCGLSAGCKTPCAKGGCSDTGQWTAFGEKMKLTGDKAICAGEILADAAKYAGKSIRVCGMVDEVCARKGCWIRLTGPGADEALFVKFTCPVEGRLVPMEAQGRLAIVEGTLEVNEISEEMARHYAEEGKAPAAEVAKIVGPQKQIQLNSPAAKIDLTKKVASAG